MTNDELKQFKASLSITTVAQALGIDVVRGRCRCFYPQRHVHGDRTPSVSISEERGSFRCWVCDDVRGDVISLVQIVKNCNFVEALNWLAETFPFLVQNGRRETFAGRSAPNSFPQERPSEDSEKDKLVSDDEKKKIILSFLKMLSPVDNTPAGAWLARRRIYKPVWDKMLLRTIVNYQELNQRLRDTYDVEILKYVGLFNDKGNLKYYKHPLIFPYLDSGRRAFYFQARSLDKTVVPKELNLKGTVPYPYNVSALDQKAGWIYLCEGAVDTLTLLNQKFDAVGIPGVRNFKVEWLPLFKNKNVVLCLDKDDAGRSGMDYLQGVFAQAGIRTIILGEGLDNIKGVISEGQDINEWFGGKK